MSTARLLDGLDGVKATGPGRWIARCPAHDDQRPSLTIRETDDGMTLVKCWAGCAFLEIVHAAGLQPSDLFPPKPLSSGTHSTRGHRKPFPAADILAAVAHEAMIASVAARDVAGGSTLTEPDIARLFLASGRLLAAAEATGNG